MQFLPPAVSGLSRVGIMVNPESPGDAAELKVLSVVAERLRLQYRVFEVRTEGELPGTFAAAEREGLQALYVSWNPLFNAHRASVVAMAASIRLPAIYGFREFVQSGGLMSYGPDLPDLYRRSAIYIDKILKGEKPGELPLQLAERYELFINLRTAKSLGLTISQSLVLLANEVIE